MDKGGFSSGLLLCNNSLVPLDARQFLDFAYVSIAFLARFTRALHACLLACTLSQASQYTAGVGCAGAKMQRTHAISPVDATSGGKNAQFGSTREIKCQYADGAVRRRGKKESTRESTNKYGWGGRVCGTMPIAPGGGSIFGQVNTRFHTQNRYAIRAANATHGTNYRKKTGTTTINKRCSRRYKSWFDRRDATEDA